MELKGICKYCLGCNKLEDRKYAGINRCKNFVAGEVNWEKTYREELRNGNK